VLSVGAILIDAAKEIFEIENSKTIKMQKADVTFILIFSILFISEN